MRAALIALLSLSLGGACTKAKDEPAPPTKPAIARTPDAPPRPRPAALSQVTIKALGMYCEETCPMKVRMALAEMPAVYELGFDVSTESIFVSYDTTLGDPKSVTKPMLIAIKEAGFDPWLAKESWPADAAKVVQVVR